MYLDSYSLSHRAMTVHYELMWAVIVYHSGLRLYIMMYVDSNSLLLRDITVHYELMWTVIVYHTGL